MKELNFPCGSSLSNGMGWDWLFDLTEEEYELLKSKKDKVFHLNEDSDLNEINDKILEEIIENEINNVRIDPEYLEFYILDDNEKETIYKQGFENFVNCCDDNEIRKIIEKNCSFYVNMPYELK